MFDLLIRGGTVLDGTGSEPIQADIGIIGDRIAAIGNLVGSYGEEFDANQLYVSPGFIDIHSHSDYTAPSRSSGSQRNLPRRDNGSRWQLRPWMLPYRRPGTRHEGDIWILGVGSARLEIGRGVFLASRTV